MAEGPSANLPPHIALELSSLAKRPAFIFVAAALPALLLAGCDTGAGDPAQENAPTSDASAAISLDGFLDRSFAGDERPELVFTDPDGDTLALADVEGPVLINLWATWCAPCVHELPLLDELAGDMAGRLTVLTVNEDLPGSTAVEPFYEANPLPNLPHWRDEANDAAFAFGSEVLPITVLYDAQGREVWRVIGAYDWAGEQARAEIAEGLAASAE